MSTSPEPSADATASETASAVTKRYERLVALRAKASKGKGAWYWQHFEPLLIKNPNSKIPKSVKLRCTVCDAAFSASNPSRTASEHLRRANCPNSALILNPIPPLPPLASPSSSSHRKRTSDSRHFAAEEAPPPPLLSGGKDDLKPLALLEDSVKKLKSPKPLPVPVLTGDQIAAAVDLLSDWFFESGGAVAFSSLENLKFKAFLRHLGLPELSRHDIATTRLESRYDRARTESEARINDAEFFQVALDCCRSNANDDDRNGYLVNFTINLPNGTRLFHRAMHCSGGALPEQYMEEVLRETVRRVSGDNLMRCIGIVADKHFATALKSLEVENQWMVNVPCLLRGLSSLIKDLYRELPLFVTVAEKCLQVADVINSRPEIRNYLEKALVHRFVRVPSPKCDASKNSHNLVEMLEDILSCSQTLNFAVFDDSLKSVSDIIRDVAFWNDVEATHSLVKFILSTCEEVKMDRPMIGQCFPIWKALKDKLKELCSKHGIVEGPVDKIVEKRFRKCYHPVWSAAFVLDPLNLVRDVASGNYLPPFNLLTSEHENDIERLVTRMLSGDEARMALIELARWQSDGLDPLYAQAVQVKRRDATTGKMKVANPQSSRLVWSTCLKGFESLGKVAVRVLFLHAICSCGIEWDPSFVRWFRGQGNCPIAEKLVLVAAEAKLGRREMVCSEERNDDNEMFDEVFDRSMPLP
ncbi:uncharacterized protein LOC127245057 [Andrographis paniculata]|uniref:uncharacterized protein LOC127245057 n=1 Tax=Andrographis paniculata TaxID=175694 RepID=UPI0021E8E7BF|nr:uncharacterized protein LOC127245057 [Andrographis paniculata]